MRMYGTVGNIDCTMVLCRTRLIPHIRPSLCTMVQGQMPLKSIPFLPISLPQLPNTTQALVLDGKNSYQHYADWFYGHTTGAASMHIDPRLPNGGGALNGSAFRQCKTFPYPQ